MATSQSFGTSELFSTTQEGCGRSKRSAKLSCVGSTYINRKTSFSFLKSSAQLFTNLTASAANDTVDFVVKIACEHLNEDSTMTTHEEAQLKIQRQT